MSGSEPRGSAALRVALVERSAARVAAERDEAIAFAAFDAATARLEVARTALATREAEARAGWCDGDSAAWVAHRRSGLECALADARHAVDQAERSRQAAQAALAERRAAAERSRAAQEAVTRAIERRARDAAAVRARREEDTR